jgi:hypothetical protein
MTQAQIPGLEVKHNCKFVESNGGIAGTERGLRGVIRRNGEREG